MKLDINSSERRIELLIKRNHDLFEIPVYWNFDDIENGLQKIDKLMVIKSDVKETDSNWYFKFTECRVYLQVEMEKFLKALTDGFIQFDIRLEIYRSGENEGKYHNHGGGFRIKSRDLYRLYRNVTTV
ncbi:MAG: MvaI/BcnI family restriction endonuclease [Flavobacteriaceae bacterium]|nr:MvaI/BcnI family restriction endonuclease [Flavobacteriaceae bacterium]MCY4216469.1 MvaI/BcnI family restriction endonuclease [Flavobacteriaceae bacterium]MCY4253966.1 MvaI/BcnI family restriction endonuclease [Flavobacteriaceae bacterium]